MRLQLFLSHNGVCSRRKAFEWIKEGRVKVNKEIVREPSLDINPPKDHVVIEGREVKDKSFEYILLNKPQGYTTTKYDRFAEKTVFDLLPKELQHLQPVGRLDKDTEGLLLFTNDGDTAYKLTHPKFNIDKTYFLRIIGRLENSDRIKIERGLIIDGERTSPSRIFNVKTGQNWTEALITIHEGRKRQVRVMFGMLRYRVTFLKRIIQGPLRLGELKLGACRKLNQYEIEALRKI